ncbi:MAG: class A beta-lactamase-related serine hydrolase [Candidatus Heimdallarchaeota archaeon]|nr:class A beta-lactamase-related serine hydrolase [Candidatus Heimdallarchaeota archaeon]
MLSRDCSIIHGKTGSIANNYLARVVNFGFSGTVLIAKGDQPYLYSGYGYANVKKRIRNTIETIFDIGSISKQFTVAAILQLEEQGFLKTSDPISNFLTIPADKRSITIHHLLSHTSGLPRFYGGDFDFYDQSDFIKGVLESKLLAEPGKSFNYSNPSYSLLAIIIEELTGQSFRKYVTQNVFIPADMTNTGWYGDTSWDINRIAHAYTGKVDNGSPRTWPEPSWPHIGSGGVCTTIGDLFKWFLALKGRKILSETSKKKMWTPYLDDYAYGWEITNSTKYGLIRGHDGANYLGFSCDASWFVDKDVITILLCNRWIDNIYLADVMKIKLQELILDKTAIFSLPPNNCYWVENNFLDRYTGVYLFPSGDKFTVDIINNKLRVKAIGQEAVNLLVSSKRSSLLYDELSKKTETIVEGILNDNYKYFKDFLAEKDRFENFKVFLLKKKFISANNRRRCTGYQIIGTTPIWWLETPDTASTSFVIKFDQELEYYRFYWNDIGITEITGAFPVTYSILLMPKSEREFTGYHLGTGTIIDVNFIISDSGTVDGLVVINSGSELRVKRIY